MPVPNVKSRRFGYDLETVFETTAAGAFVNPSAYKNVTVSPGREAIEREEHLNTFADLYPADPGIQLFDASVEFDQCTETYANNKRLFSGAMGQEDSNSAITITPAACTQSLIKIASGTPQKLLKIVGHNGLTYIVPVKSFTGGTDANLAMQLPAAAVGAAMTASNLASAGGAVFSYLLGTAANTYMLEFDRSGQSGEIKYRAWGAAIRAAVFMFELRRRIAWQFGFTASRWEKSPSSPAMQLANPNVRTNPFISFACNAHLYQYSAAAAESNRTTMKKVAFSFAPKLIEETGTKGLAGDGTVPGSDITGFTRAENWQDKLSCQITYSSVNWHDRWNPEDSTAYYGLFLEFFAAKPSKAPNAPRLAVWFPYIHLAEEPTLENVNEGEAQNLMFNIGRDPSSTCVAAYIGMTAT